jgi:hypothetical protein
MLLMIQTVICEHNKVQLTDHQKCVRCLIEIASRYFNQQIMISLPSYHGHRLSRRVAGNTEDMFLVKETNSFESIFLHELLMSGRWSVFVYMNTDDTCVQPEVKEIYSNPSGYFIYLRNNISDLNERLHCLKTFHFRNLKARFVVILDKKLNEPDQEVSKILSKLWDFKIINVVVLLKLRAQDFYKRLSYQETWESFWI